MAVKGIKETEKVAVGAIRTALQPWLAPQLSDISQRLTHADARLDGMDRHFDGIDQRIDTLQKHMEEILRSMRNEIEARFDAVRSDIKRLDNIA